MTKYIHNISGSTKTYQGIEILDGNYWQIPAHLSHEFSENLTVISDIQSGDIKISRNGVDDIDTVENALHILGAHEIRSSLALDKNGTNQLIDDDSWTVVSAERVIWDLHEDYDVANDNLVVPVDGIYNFDVQLKISNFSNVSAVELAIFKRDNPDDYWFILDKKEVGAASELQLSGATQFDFYKNEEYTLKIKLYKVLPLIGVSATVQGNDDYTAWGYSLREVL